MFYTKTVILRSTVTMKLTWNSPNYLYQRTHYSWISGRTTVPFDKEATQGKHLLDLLKKTEVNVLFNDILMIYPSLLQVMISTWSLLVMLVHKVKSNSFSRLPDAFATF